MLRRIKKVLFKEPHKGIKQFRAMLDDMLNLEHPNMTQLLDYREDANSFFLIYDSCKGENLFE